MARNALVESTLLVDAHVHVHARFDARSLLDGALRNLREVASAEAGGNDMLFLLVLVGTGGSDGLEQARSRLVDNSGTWHLEETREKESVRAIRRTGEHMYLVTGRQIATREGLEILALGSNVLVSEGGGFLESLALVSGERAAAVVPWGFGKWSGRRGILVRQAVEHPPTDGFFLGDNGGRLRMPKPSLFTHAAARGIYDLPGSDPLPLPGAESAAGSRGFRLTGRVERERPAAELLRLLRDVLTQPKTFGQGVGPVRFLRNQLGLRLRRFSRGRTDRNT